MSRKLALTTILEFILMGMLFVALKANTVKASGIIYIRPEGNIDPPTALISTIDNVTYTFTDDINDQIVIERSNIIIDGNGHALQGSGNETGISLSNISNVTIKNTSIKILGYGIYLNSTSNCTISGNNITNCTRSIELYKASNFNEIINNSLTNNVFAIYAWNQSNFNRISDNNIAYNDSPAEIILLKQCQGITISNNRITNNRLDAIRLIQSTNNTIKANNITSNHGYGIWLSDQSSSNIIAANELSDNNKGITLTSYSNDNTIIGNNITNNGVYGVYLVQGTNNAFTHNNFIGNDKQVNVSLPNLPNIWNDELEGNYWSNYTGTDADHDGIGDTAHVLDASNIDNRPLMGMFHTYNTTIGQLVDVVSNSTIINFMYFPLDSTIKLKVTNTTGTQTYGFCRIAISHTLMNTTNLTVIIDEGITPVLFENYTLHDNSTHRWIYFAYPHTIHEIIIIPEFPTTTLLILLTTATCLIATATRKTKPRRHPQN